MELHPVDLLGGFYADDSKPWSVQDTVNWLPEVAEVPGTRTQMKLASPPGLREYMRLGDRPIRGLRNVEGTLFAVCGNDLHQISTKATSTVRGQIPGVGRVQMAHNQITGGNELLLVNGQSTGYVWNTAKNTYLRITDDGYPGARAADYLDSYLLQVEPFGRFWFHSQLANALDYNTLDRYESEASPDKIVTLIVSQFEVVVFNETTTEFFYNAGGNTGTLQNKRVLIDRGCASGDTVQRLDNSVFWLGNDGVVYRLNGYQAIPISTGPVQAAIRDNNWKQAFAFTWEDGKHKVYYLTFPDGKTWGYDVVTGVWHRRASFGLDRWRLNHLVRWNGMWIGSDFQRGRLWVLDWDYHLEGNRPIISERVSPVLHANQNALVIPSAELVIETGEGPNTEPSLPKIVGNMPNGFPGMSGSGQYTRSGGMLPYGPVSTTGGLPTTASVAADGSYTFTYSQEGEYAFTVSFKDDDGTLAQLIDTVSVTNSDVWLFSGGGSLPGFVFGPYKQGDWSKKPIIQSFAPSYFYYQDGIIHASAKSNLYYYSKDRGDTWLPAGNKADVSTDGARMAFKGEYAFLCSGVQSLQRRALPDGDWSIPLNTGMTRANSIAIVGERILIASDYSDSCSYSDDDGQTWQLGGQFQQATIGGPLLSTDGAVLVIFFNNAFLAGYQCHIKRSTDAGQTWSASQFQFPTASVSNTPAEIVFDGEFYVAVTTLGEIARSNDGITWALVPAFTLPGVTQMAVGYQMIFASCGSNGVWYSQDHGATWTQRALPEGVTSAIGAAWVLES
ncbi:photosystem II stability/assembly factor-like uncharacterized protein [Xanthomonas arboricola]|uniref:hypothetical protein n=1 Tax=Xanthomonas arboricola TaxID=56448 RepID=UPI00141B83D4|nr:hypothetical protein [Xanthomonas arboricola]NIJ86992.1 photosystem II stability/assembly factor-like uncharacterized protein [Xanthomonas arboricola]